MLSPVLLNAELTNSFFIFLYLIIVFLIILTFGCVTITFKKNFK